MRVHISAQHISVPRRCVCCDGTPDHEFAATASRTTGKRVVRTQERSWMFPRCAACAAHKRKWDSACGTLTVALVLAAAIALIGHNRLAIALPFALFVAGVGLLIASFGMRAAKALQHEGCTSCAATVRYSGWSGTIHSFVVDSERYGVALMRANRAKLVNVSAALWPVLDEIDRTA